MQRKAFDLLKEKNFQELYDLSVGKVFSNNIELMEFVGPHGKFDTEFATCKLNLDEKEFAVDYIGTHSEADNMWFSAEIEKEIPDEGVNAIINIRKLLTQVGLEEICESKIETNEELTPDMIATIHTAFMSEKQAYYKAKLGDVSLFMRLNDLPEEVFAKISPVKFIPRVMEIINTTNVKNHKLMVESFLLNNGSIVKVKGNTVVGVFGETEIKFVFDDLNRLVSADGVLNDGGKKEETIEVVEAPIVAEVEIPEVPKMEETPIVEDMEETPVAEETPNTEIADEEDAIDERPTVMPEVEDVEAENVVEEEPIVPVVLPAEDTENLNLDETTDEEDVSAIMESLEESLEADIEDDEEFTEGIMIDETPEAPKTEEAPVVEDIVEAPVMPEVENVTETPSVEIEDVAINERPTVLPEVEDVAVSEDVAIEEPTIPVVLPAEEVEETPETIEAEEDEGDDEEYNKILNLADAMLNCGEQIGLFDELGIEDEEVINKICNLTAIRFMNNGEAPESLVEAIIIACERNGFTVSDKTARLFASCYVDSYLMGE